MSKAYNNYIVEHKACVKRGLVWILNKISFAQLLQIFPNIDITSVLTLIDQHDFSKFSEEEYQAYDDYFYAEERTPEIEEVFNYAWLHHIHNNPHHWQYWVLREDDSSDPQYLDIPDNYIIEMISDWWSFSWKNYAVTNNKQDLYSIFSWYEAHLNIIKMHPNAKQKVEDLLSTIKDILERTTDEENL